MTRKYLPYLVPALIFVYVSVRSYTLSFTHDEALSYLIIKGDEGLQNTANHHWLNTWLMDFFSMFSEKEFSLRLPALIGFIFYSVFSIRILKGRGFYISVLIGLPALFLNNYLLDFFSLARGYGLSVGLMMASLYYLLILKKKPVINAYSSIIFAALALCANLNLLNFFIADCFLVFIFLVSKGPVPGVRKLLRHLLLILPLLLVFLYIIIRRLLLLKEYGQLYYGNEKFTDGFDSIFIWSLDLSVLPDYFLLLVRYGFLLLWITALAISLVRKNFSSNLFKVWALITIIFIGLLIEHNFFGALYPQNRTFVYAWPLLMLLGVFVSEEVRKKIPVKSFVLALVAIMVFTLPLTHQFVRRMTTASVAEWSYDAGTSQAAEILATKNSGKKIKVAHHWLFGPALRYYVESRQLNIEIYRLDERPEELHDYIYEFCDAKLPEVWKPLSLKGGTGCLYTRQ